MYKNQIKKVLKQQAHTLNLELPLKNIKISKLGVGENHLSMLAQVGRKKFVFRIGMRKKYEKNMKHEFDALKILPKDFGPEPLYFDTSKKFIPHTFSVLSYIPGKHITKWYTKHLKIHAKKLAELHKKRYSYWRRFHERKKTRFDFYKEFQRDLKIFGWDSVRNDSTLSELYPFVEKYIKDNNYLFTQLKKFSLIHSDPFSPNILFSKNEVRYVDWEHIKIGDNALDLAQLYSKDFHCPPWTIKLTGKRLQAFIGTYLKHMKDPTLQARIKVWTVYVYFLDLIYLTWKLKNFHSEHAAFSKTYYRKLVRLTSDSLKKRFL